MTWNELLEKAKAGGANCADLAIGRMMDYVEEETGKWPDWDDEAPQWAVEVCCGH